MCSEWIMPDTRNIDVDMIVSLHIDSIFGYSLSLIIKYRSVIDLHMCSQLNHLREPPFRINTIHAYDKRSDFLQTFAYRYFFLKLELDPKNQRSPNQN